MRPIPCVGSRINTRVCERGTKGCEVVHGAETFRCVCSATLTTGAGAPACPSCGRIMGPVGPHF